MASEPTLQFAYRGKEGVFLFNKAEHNEEVKLDTDKSGVNCRTLQYSKDGALFAWSLNECVLIANADTGNIVRELPAPKVSFLVFSPRNTYLATWQNPTSSSEGTPENLHIWDIKTGELVAKFHQKSQNGWEPQWSDDESIFARNVSGEVQFYQGSNIQEGIKSRLQLPGLTFFELSSGNAPYKVAVFVPEHQERPAFVRIFNYGAWNVPVSSKSFYKADKVQMIWNGSGTKVLVLTSTEVDSTGKSYFGETGLYFLDSGGKFDSRVTLDKEGPVHDIAWSPNSKEFVVVYGFMPAKAVLFDNKCNVIHDFGAYPVNTIKFSPYGQIISFAGLGNLAGEMFLWDREKLKLISDISARDASHVEWAPDARHIITATLFPRLRVDNGYKIWKFDGTLIEETLVPELYQIAWRPGKFPNKPLPAVSQASKDSKAQNSSSASFSASGSFSSAAKKAYVPPHLRGLQNDSAPRALHELLDENINGTPQKDDGKGKGKEKDSQDKGKKKDAKPPLDKEELEKKIKNVNKKLKDIQALKDLQNEGKTLELNQLDKIKKEGSIQKELRDLQKQLEKL